MSPLVVSATVCLISLAACSATAAAFSSPHHHHGTYDALKFERDGSMSEVRIEKNELLHRSGMLPRDLIAIESAREATIEPRARCVIVSLSHVRAIVFADHLLLFNPGSPDVRRLAADLKEILAYAHRLRAGEETCGDRWPRSRGGPVWPGAPVNRGGCLPICGWVCAHAANRFDRAGRRCE